MTGDTDLIPKSARSPELGHGKPSIILGWPFAWTVVLVAYIHGDASVQIELSLETRSH